MRIGSVRRVRRIIGPDGSFVSEVGLPSAVVWGGGGEGGGDGSVGVGVCVCAVDNLLLFVSRDCFRGKRCRQPRHAPPGTKLLLNRRRPLFPRKIR